MVVHSDTASIDDPTVQQRLIDVTAVFDGDTRFGAVIAPQPGMTISPDGHTGILIAGANANADDMVKAVDDVKDELTALSGDGIEVYPTGSSALWSDFNKANHDAMIQAELFSWPVTLAIMVLAFGSLVAAGLPLLLTVAGLVASAGGLVLLNEVTPISVWAMNFAMMFALALGIDYALFIVARFRDALRTADPRAAVAETMGHRRQSGAPVRDLPSWSASRQCCSFPHRPCAPWPGRSHVPQRAELGNPLPANRGRIRQPADLRRGCRELQELAVCQHV